MPKIYRLTGIDGVERESPTKGSLGGHRKLRIYGRLDGASALRALARDQYKAHRVFFADEMTAVAAGYRPCGKCLPDQYADWKKGGLPGSETYPWKVLQ